MCSMMAAEFESVSPDVPRELVYYFRVFQNWLTKQFSELNNPDPPNAAPQVLNALEGALVLARLKGDVTIVSRSLDSFVTGWVCVLS